MVNLLLYSQFIDNAHKMHTICIQYTRYESKLSKIEHVLNLILPSVDLSYSFQDAVQIVQVYSPSPR